MKRQEAIELLAGCKGLADRLVTGGVNIELTDADRATVVGFEQVCDYDAGRFFDDNVFAGRRVCNAPI